MATFRTGGNPLERALPVMAAVVASEVVLLVYVYQFLLNFECPVSGGLNTCMMFGDLLTRFMVVFGALVIFLVVQPAEIPTGARRTGFAALHLLGFAMLFAPGIATLFVSPAAIALPTIAVWTVGSLMAGAGAFLWFFSPQAFLNWLRSTGFAPVWVCLTAFFVPDLAEIGQLLWNVEDLARVTFDAVHQVLFRMGNAPFAEPETYRIGLDDFVVSVGSPCSGIEGFVLVTAFICFNAWLGRGELRFPHYFLLIPLGIAASWVFNVLRISLLVWIGARVSPELAMEGFHSQAGWIAFTILSFGILWLSSTVSWWRITESGSVASTALPVTQDWNAARLFPFIAFMMSGVVTTAAFATPAIGYPLKAAAMLVTLLFFRRLYLARIAWAIDPVAVAGGAVVGVMWLFLLPFGVSDDAALTGALAGLGTTGFALWAITRIAGTVLLVPLVEELVFRGYILAEMDRSGRNARIAAIAVSTALFALLHGRWLAAGLAGLMFALVWLRRRSLADAVVAHMVANAIVAAWAVLHRDWGAI
ncbi:exosortase E/protease, VPEID-CTERM system [Amaricoccus tamworthensis]|uniref:exosortase E/protease, VPEID-CTERM system n=1 Tax=Amaricoccus tamworthensis TaxID=57002 RepID=UPI003C79A163